MHTSRSPFCSIQQYLYIPVITKFKNLLRFSCTANNNATIGAVSREPSCSGWKRRGRGKGAGSWTEWFTTCKGHSHSVKCQHLRPARKHCIFPQLTQLPRQFLPNFRKSALYFHLFLGVLETTQDGTGLTPLDIFAGKIKLWLNISFDMFGELQTLADHTTLAVHWFHGSFLNAIVETLIVFYDSVIYSLSWYGNRPLALVIEHPTLRPLWFIQKP